MVWWETTPGIKNIAVRKFGLLPHPPFMLVAHIGRFDGIGAGVDTQNQIDDVFQRRIGGVRDVPASETDMVADPVLRNTFEGVIERLDAQLRPFAVFFRALLHQVVIHVGQDRVDALNQQSRFVDRRLFLSQGVGDGVDIVVFVAVMLIDAVIGGAGRRHAGEERLLHLVAFERGLEGSAIALDGAGLRIGNAADAGLGRAPLDGARHLGQDGVPKTLEIAPHPLHRAQLIGAAFEHGHPLEHIGGPARLAVFAVIDDIDASLGLLFHHLGDGALQQLRVGRLGPGPAASNSAGRIRLPTWVVRMRSSLGFMAAGSSANWPIPPAI